MLLVTFSFVSKRGWSNERHLAISVILVGNAVIELSGINGSFPLSVRKCFARLSLQATTTRSSTDYFTTKQSHFCHFSVSTHVRSLVHSILSAGLSFTFLPCSCLLTSFLLLFDCLLFYYILLIHMLLNFFSYYSIVYFFPFRIILLYSLVFYSFNYIYSLYIPWFIGIFFFSLLFS